MSTNHTERYRSLAEWPEGIVTRILDGPPNVTDDIHETRDEAVAICGLLRRNGFGGEGIHFPVGTWVLPESAEFPQTIEALRRAGEEG